jgi:NADH-quinone oxidoreductase subunit C
MTPDELATAWAERFGDRAEAAETFGMLTVDVGPDTWVEALTFARDDLDCGFFDWLTGVDELDEGFGVVAHVYSPTSGHHVLVRTRVPREEPVLPTVTPVYRGANWHERETYEMFGLVFEGHPNLTSLLLPDGFEGHPLRKEFVLAARVAKPWPGAKEPGESGHGAPSRRRMLPPGVPDDWGPQATAGAASAPARGERPARRERPERSERPARGVEGGGDV